MPRSFIIKLYSETQVSGRLGMSGGISPRHGPEPLIWRAKENALNNPPCPITPTLTSSSVGETEGAMDSTSVFLPLLLPITL